jgi:hypothetical protein
VHLASRPAIFLTARDAVDDTLTRAALIAGLVGIALIHVLQAPEAFAETGYLGALFVGAVVGALGLSALLSRTSDARVVAAAGALAGLILLGYLITRTVGLPAATEDIGEWAEPLGLASMVAEGLVLAVSVGALAGSGPRPRRAGVERPAAADRHVQDHRRGERVEGGMGHPLVTRDDRLVDPFG